MSNNKTLIGFLAGAFAGGLTAILFAPASGAETRRQLASRGDDANEDTSEIKQQGSPSTQVGEEKIRSVMHHAKEMQ